MSDRVDKLLQMAFYPSASDGEALNAVRAAGRAIQEAGGLDRWIASRAPLRDDLSRTYVDREVRKRQEAEAEVQRLQAANETLRRSLERARARIAELEGSRGLQPPPDDLGGPASRVLQTLEDGAWRTVGAIIVESGLASSSAHWGLDELRRRELVEVAPGRRGQRYRRGQKNHR